MRRTLRRCCTVAIGVLLPQLPLAAEEDPALLTRAEATGFVETTRYDDVVALLEHAATRGDGLYLSRFGYTVEGRAIPLLVAGDVANATPEAVLASGKLRVYLQGNIHGGEVAGKEALLMLVRALATGERAGWTDDLVLLVGPIFNADGNEAVRLTHRPLQHGPIGGMGTRSNAQGYDLNRDHMKLASPEARSVARLMSQWDPHVVVDLHTTNGTLHGYHLTYAPPLHPATPAAIDEVLRGQLLPAVTRRLAQRDGLATYHYGNVMARPDGPGDAWVTFDHRPRFGTNYAGIRNRIGVLSEVFAYLPFEERVRVTYRFVEEVLDELAARAGDLEELVAAEDGRRLVGQPLPLRASAHAAAEPAEILMAEAEEQRHPYTGEIMLRRSERVRRERMPEYIAFRGAESERVPAAYLLPAELDDVVALIQAHGVRTGTLGTEVDLEVDVFRIESSRTDATAFQGRHERTVQGRWVSRSRQLPPDTVVVDMSQPLARLAFLLLEPRSDDGLLNWGVLDPHLADDYPILRSHRLP